MFTAIEFASAEGLRAGKICALLLHCTIRYDGTLSERVRSEYAPLTLAEDRNGLEATNHKDLPPSMFANSHCVQVLRPTGVAI